MDDYTGYYSRDLRLISRSLRMMEMPVDSAAARWERRRHGALAAAELERLARCIRATIAEMDAYASEGIPKDKKD